MRTVYLYGAVLLLGMIATGISLVAACMIILGLLYMLFHIF